MRKTLLAFTLLSISSVAMAKQSTFHGVYTTDFVPNCTITHSSPINASAYFNAQEGDAVDSQINELREELRESAYNGNWDAIIGLQISSVSGGAISNNRLYISGTTLLDGVQVKLKCK